jgi:hypothetical protein
MLYFKIFFETDYFSSCAQAQLDKEEAGMKVLCYYNWGKGDEDLDR